MTTEITRSLCHAKGGSIGWTITCNK
jgi:hypothetical protein